MRHRDSLSRRADVDAHADYLWECWVEYPLQRPETGCFFSTYSVDSVRYTESWDVVNYPKDRPSLRVLGGPIYVDPKKLRSSYPNGSENSRPTMDPRDTAPDSWEQEDDVEATIDGQLESALASLNVNAKPFVPNVNAAEFVPSFAMKAPSENLDSTGE